jgi:hypothetical protein
MTTEPKYKHAVFPPDQWERIVNFRYEQRIPSEMAAIRELIDRGLKATAQPIRGLPQSACSACAEPRHMAG